MGLPFLFAESQRNFPTVSSENIRTSYSYDSAGRLEYETVTKETGSTTKLSRTQYSYSYLSYGRQVVRTEQTDFVGTWVEVNHTTYQYNTLGWQIFEEREDPTGGGTVVYDITQEYDKVGNRTRFHRNVPMGQESNYGKSMDLSYTFDVRNTACGGTSPVAQQWTGRQRGAGLRAALQTVECLHETAERKVLT